LSTSLSNAFSGLTAASRAAEVVSSNVANAMTPGYALRELEISSRITGGVGIEGIIRHVDERALADRREADAGVAFSNTGSATWLRLETAIGYPTEAGSLVDRITTLQADLVSAAARPDEPIRLEKAIASAVSLTGHIQSVADDIQAMRSEADSSIASMIDGLNASLEQVQVLNRQIQGLGANKQDASVFLDQRQAVIDSIAEIIPIRQVARDGGRVALYSLGGLSLIDGTAAEFSFQPASAITAFSTLGGGQLSGLALNGHSIDVAGSTNPLGDGALSGAFAARDSYGPEAQAYLDAFSRDLIERFQDPTLDPTLAGGLSGLFTDLGQTFDPVNETAISSRIRVNAMVDPDQGGSAWRLRDGAQAASPGDIGDSALLTALADKLTEARPPASGPMAGQAGSVADQATDLLSWVAVRQDRAEDDHAFHAARVEAFATVELTGGVDTDDEMQKLLLVEQAYAANARVVQTLDQLMRQLLEI
jgi:flagellar hook-associated protein 1 FlgK